ncbi:unnamed protein product [Rhizophagus irregularis]|nr:unnamed protein product [Rhizophagus irregularis]
MIKKQTVMGLTQARSKNLTFDKYVDGDAGRADSDDDEETPNYNYDGLMRKQLNETSRQADLFIDPDKHHINTYKILPEPQLDDNLLDFLLCYRQTYVG